MINKLSKQGESFALVIDPSLLARLGIDETTPLEVSTDGRALIVAPVADAQRHEQFETALADANRQYAKTLERLAE